MKLSVVIVSYNVKYFLEQCLHSVSRATRNIEAEVLVVDNDSVDGSVAMVEEKFPWVTTIVNRDNVGFSKANNQAIRVSGGEYILLLNPDTVVEEDTFSKIIGFMDKHPEAGGLGVKMVDGKGKFLPESKRGLPTPAVAFYKISGLSKLFPRSRTFGRYHLGYLDPGEIHEVEILSGAFMLLRREALDKAGLLDETFFMYGEDIDLSYRIIQAGYKNYYYPKTRIIHYKGESTKKSSINYVVTFYNAMIIFARKHFSHKNARIISLLINLAVYFRAFIALLNRFFRNALLPIADAVLLFGGLIAIKNYWEQNVVFPEGGSYPETLVAVAITGYVFIWLLSVFLSGGYDRPVKISRLIRGLVAGTVVILIIYALLPENYRFSRAVIIFGTLWGIISMTGLRFTLHLLKMKNFRLGIRTNRRYAVVGDQQEGKRVADLIRKAYLNPGFIGLISVADDNPGTEEGYIGKMSQMAEIIRIFKIDEVIFCAKDLPSDKIIDKMSELSGQQIEFRIAPPESLYIIGSKSISTSGDIYIVELDSIAKTNNKRSKRFLDIVVSLMMTPLLPLSVFIVRKPFGMIANMFVVLFGRLSWVGYHPETGHDSQKLPPIKKGVLYPTDALTNQTLSPKTIERLNLLYARDYKIVNDLNIILKGFRNAGRR